MASSLSVRRAHAVVAIVSWLSVLLVAIVSAADGFAARTVVEGNLFGTHTSGIAGAPGRIGDTFSYFTVWSNVVVAVAFTLLALRPGVDSLLHRVLLLDALLMITITTIVYWAMLAANDTWQGWSVITSPLQHLVVGVLAVGVWATYGPRGWLSFRLLPWALVVPLIWIVWTLLRGRVIDAYPYDFTDVSTLGYARVATTLAAILAIGLLIAAIYCRIDRALERRSPKRA
ncbi:Pr6Pr family membrane protein [Yimella sp. NH-Cas1]|uniref:Pr6Pr family membrane protein n=1 Tax=Yimella sp. NH-Cas1 TaxID=2917726 RepID=UPI001EFA5E84|nr:Pr6Pr family membrane protein [Yimella sp. NH-Cas1]MCG8656532.1 Pr6Pr family membrane protein [Yimella sp. NH-Cas1]